MLSKRCSRPWFRFEYESASCWCRAKVEGGLRCSLGSRLHGTRLYQNMQSSKVVPADIIIRIIVHTEYELLTLLCTLNIQGINIMVCVTHMHYARVGRLFLFSGAAFGRIRKPHASREPGNRFRSTYSRLNRLVTRGSYFYRVEAIPRNRFRNQCETGSPRRTFRAVSSFLW